MKTKMTLIYPSGQTLAKEVYLPAEPNLDQLYHACGGVIPKGYLEHVRIITDDDEVVSMLVHESGHMERLAYNAVATEHYRRNAVRSGANAEGLPWIVGPAVLFDRIVWF